MGGLCNVMFKLSAAISLALDNKVDFVFSNEFIRQGDKDIVCGGFNDYRIYYDNVLRNINFIDKLPSKYRIHEESNTFNYQLINYNEGENLLLDGYFQSEKYFINNKNYIINLFKPTNEIKLSILIKKPNIQNSISIHVRRGDYLDFPNHHPQQSLDYYISAVNLLGIDNDYLIFSDDLDGIKDMFDFIPNKQFVTLGKNYLDLYAMSMCKHNIICNSTFSWWGAYLNENKDKTIIGPKNWFGQAYSHWNTYDILPDNWIKF
jgi:hypothetical protein